MFQQQSVCKSELRHVHYTTNKAVAPRIKRERRRPMDAARRLALRELATHGRLEEALRVWRGDEPLRARRAMRDALRELGEREALAAWRRASVCPIERDDPFEEAYDALARRFGLPELRAVQAAELAAFFGE